MGSWTDCIFAGGKKIALAPGEDRFLQTSGQASGSWAMLRLNLPTPVDPSGTAYTVKAGDRLCFRQYNSGGAGGGPWLMFSNGVSTIWNWTTPDGQWLSDSFGPRNQWATRCIDLTDAYDAAGNVANDGIDKYIYDGEGRLCAVQNGSGAMTGSIYDGSGERVAKGGISAWSCDQTTNGFSATSNYIYGANSQQLAEYSGTGALLHESVLANGALLASSTQSAGAWLYAFNDWLGTKRVEVTPDGQVATFSSLPFGDFLSQTGTALDATEHHFTGKERDAESGNDYFGARYYSSTLGRFLSPDWDAKPTAVPYASFGDPQTLNLYAYGENAPLNKVDADGHVANPAMASLYSLEDIFNTISSCEDGGDAAAGESCSVGVDDNGNPNPGLPVSLSSEEVINFEYAEAQATAQTAAANAQNATAQAQQQSSKPTNQPVDPVPTGADGKPSPPPVPVPGCPSCGWRWSPDKNNPDRGGRWVPDGPLPPGVAPGGASWDTGSRGGPGHWDVDDGRGNRGRYGPDGNPMPDNVAHPPGWRPVWNSVAGWVGDHKRGLIVGGIVVGVGAAIILTGGAAAPLVLAVP